MSFPSIPSIPSVVPSDIQKSAFEALRNARAAGTSLFSNPLVGKVNDIRASASSLGGFPLADISSVMSDIPSIPSNLPGAAALNAQISAALGSSVTDVTQHLSGFHLDKMANVDGMFDSLTSPAVLLAQQTDKVVNNMQQVMSSFSSYSAIKEQFSTDTLGDVSSVSICDSMRDLAGSLGGAADDMINFANDAIAGVTDMLSSASDAVKGALTSAVDTVKGIVSDIKTAISGLIGGTDGLDMSLFDDLKSAFQSMKAGVTDFMESAASAVGRGIADLKASISGMADDIMAGISDMTDMISNELAKIGEVYDYLKDAALALSWPSLNPCAKQIASSVAGEAARLAEEAKQKALAALPGGTFDAGAVAAAVTNNPISRLVA